MQEHDDARALEEYVALLYDLLGFRTRLRQILGGQEIDVLAEGHIQGIGLATIAIECKHRSNGTVSNQEIYNYINVINSLRNQNLVIQGIIITDAKFSARAYEAAKNQPVTLMYLDELENQLLDLRDVAAAFVSEYKKTNIYDSYLHLSAKRVSDGGDKSPLSNKTAANDIHSSLVETLQTDFSGVVTILGDYGAGKTTLLERIKYEFAKFYLSLDRSRIPFLIHLKSFYAHTSFDDFLTTAIKKNFHRNIPLSLFNSALNESKFVVLLDGFDEMTSHSTSSRRAEDLMRLAPLLTCNSPVILTCRPSYFVSVNEFLESMRAVQSLTEPHKWKLSNTKSKKTIDFRKELQQLEVHLNSKMSQNNILMPNPYSWYTFELQSLSGDQIDKYLVSYEPQFQKTTRRGWESIKEFLSSVYDLSDLMTRPILLKLIVETILAGAIDLDKSNIQFGPSSLYEIYTRLKLQIDWQKGVTRQGLLTREERTRFSEILAMEMLKKERLTIEYDDIMKAISNYNDDRSLFNSLNLRN